MNVEKLQLSKKKMVRCEEQRKSRVEAYLNIREGLDFLQ
jgi:hypothetical protein